MAILYEVEAERIEAAFATFTTTEQNDLLKRLLSQCHPLQLRLLYAMLKPLLAIDFVEFLPRELTFKIFGYLDATTLGRAALVSKTWRDVADLDYFWRPQCARRDWLKYGEYQFETQIVRSPTFWKQVFRRRYCLRLNWANGRYECNVLKGHKLTVTSMDTDGTTLVSGSRDNTLRVWDVGERKCITVIDAHSDAVLCVQMLPAIDRLVSGCADGLVRVFTMAGRLLMSLEGHSGSVDCLRCNDKVIVSGSTDKNLRLWDMSTGACIRTMTGHTDEIRAVDINPHRIVSASWDETLRVWNINTGACTATLAGHTEVVHCFQFDNRRIVSGGGDGLVKLWAMDSSNCKMTLTGHEGEVYCLQYNDSTIATGGADGTVRLWDMNTGVMIKILKEHIGLVRCLRMDDWKLVTAGDRRRIVVWDLKTGTCLNVMHRHPTLVHLMWMGDTKLISASPDAPGTLTIVDFWNTKDDSRGRYGSESRPSSAVPSARKTSTAGSAENQPAPPVSTTSVSGQASRRAPSLPGTGATGVTSSFTNVSSSVPSPAPPPTVAPTAGRSGHVTASTGTSTVSAKRA